MRISVWSSDVCSSDLPALVVARPRPGDPGPPARTTFRLTRAKGIGSPPRNMVLGEQLTDGPRQTPTDPDKTPRAPRKSASARAAPRGRRKNTEQTLRQQRESEHTEKANTKNTKPQTHQHHINVLLQTTQKQRTRKTTIIITNIN